MFVPAHAPVSGEIARTGPVQHRPGKGGRRSYRGDLQRTHGFEKILQRLFADYGLNMNFEQYVLVGSTLRSYLAWMKDEGQMGAFF